MTRRSGLFIALLLALQLILQPLGAMASCAVAAMGMGEGCCCAQVHEQAAAPSCCSEAPTEQEEEPESSSPCGCSVTPMPATAVLFATANFESPVSAGPFLNVIANLVPYSAPELRVPHRRARVPGGDAPLHLRLQVFRL